MEKVFSLNVNQLGAKMLEEYATKFNALPKKDKKIREEEIRSLIKSGDELDASKILDIVSPQGNFDVFISHYHENEKLALSVAAILKGKGYKPFVDSQYWLHFDAVAENLNNYHFHKDTKGSEVYDHSKTKMVQKHCDVMLISALSNVMAKCKYLIFINPPENIIGIETYSKTDSASPKTYSPWIYWELIFAEILLKENKNSLRECKMFDAEDLPSIKYPLSVKNMIKLSVSDITTNKWAEKELKSDSNVL